LAGPRFHDADNLGTPALLAAQAEGGLPRRGAVRNPAQARAVAGADDTGRRETAGRSLGAEMKGSTPKARDKAASGGDLIARVWRMPLVRGGTVTVATVEQPPRQPSMCDGCPAPCCRAGIKPVLTQEEFFSKRFPVAFQPVPWEPFGQQGVRADYIATFAVPDCGACPLLDQETNKCAAWPNPPAACLAYDCRRETREPIRSFAKGRQRLWDAGLLPGSPNPSRIQGGCGVNGIRDVVGL